VKFIFSSLIIIFSISKTFAETQMEARCKVVKGYVQEYYEDGPMVQSSLMTQEVQELINTFDIKKFKKKAIERIEATCNGKAPFGPTQGLSQLIHDECGKQFPNEKRPGLAENNFYRAEYICIGHLDKYYGQGLDAFDKGVKETLKTLKSSESADCKDDRVNDSTILKDIETKGAERTQPSKASPQ
jgi:hypothetical protein